MVLQNFAFRRLSFFFPFILVALFVFASSSTYGQKANTDSIRLERQRVMDSTRTAQKHILDSTRQARIRYNDSVKAARKIITDSLAAIRTYKESKHYKDSVTHARQHRLDSIKAVRTAYNDSVKAERKRVLDSTNAVRRAALDSMRAIQQHRRDSLSVIRTYRESKRYKDSVAITRQQRLDSIRISRQQYNDSVRQVRKQALDSAVALRKKINDSLTLIRTQRADSVAKVRKERADSLAKKKEERERMKKVQEKKKEEKMQLALELKIKKKHEAWNNEKMLKKKWSLPRRFLQNTFTHYNYYFNADRKMDEALDNMLRMNKENYDSTIALFPFDPDIDSSKLASDMDSIIQKASLGIQIHDPRTKWADDLYLLLGQAYYYKGDYENAATAFRYIISINQQRKAQKQKQTARKGNRKALKEPIPIVEKENKSTLDFLKHKSVNNEAILWLARTYTEAHKEGEAESILDLLDSEDNNLSSGNNKGRLALEKAYLNLGKENYGEASKQLEIVSADKEIPSWLRMRAAYLNGQLLNRQGAYADAAVQFQNVIELKPEIEMDFYARKNLAYNKMQEGGDQEQATAGLKKMLNDGKYAAYHEQVYYILGRLAANSNQFNEAITYLQKSISSPKSTKKQKALSFSSMGNVYYSMGDYRNAKQSYDSAAYLAKYAPDDKDIAVAVKRAGTLDKVSYPAQVIREQDSLLALSRLSENEQKDIVRRYIRSLEKARQDSIFNAQNGNASLATDTEEPGSSTSWYFSNPVLMQQGLNDFKRKWGNRTNTDNWRRGTKTGSGAIAETATEQTEEELSGFDENGIPTELSLLAHIPSSAEQKEAANKKIRKAYMELGSAYINDVNDYARAQQTLDTFDQRFPDNDNKAETLYLRYQLALKQNDPTLAQTFREQIRKEYPNSKWASLVTPIAEPTTTTATIPIAAYYDETYKMMMGRNYAELLPRSREAQKQYPAYADRFKIMEAIALVGTGKYDLADSLMTKFIADKANDSLKRWANAVLKFSKNNRLLTPSATNDSSGSLPVHILTNPDGTTKTKDAAASNSMPPEPPPLEAQPAKTPAAYTYNAKSKHYFVFYYYKAESKALGVKAALNDFNTFNYSEQKLKSSLEMLQATQGIILIKTFPSAAAAKIYMNAVAKNKQILREYKPNEYRLMMISEDNYHKLKNDKDMTPYVNFYKKHYK